MALGVKKPTIEECSVLNGEMVGTVCVIKRDLTKYLDDSLASGKEGDLGRGWDHLRKFVPKKMNKILESDAYWKLNYNSQKVDHITDKIKNNLDDRQKEQLGSFVYVHNQRRRAEAKEKDEQNLVENGFTKILGTEEELDGQKVTGFFKVSTIGALGSFDKEKALEGKLVWDKRLEALALIPKGRRTRGILIRESAFIKKDE